MANTQLEDAMARSGVTIRQADRPLTDTDSRKVPLPTGRRVSPAAGVALAVGGVLLTTWLLQGWASRLHLSNVAMAYLVLILAVATTFGRTPAILASVLAFIAFDWAFVHPIGRLTVSDPDQWLMLITFLATGLVTGQLAGALRQRAQESREREQDTHLLYELTSAMSSQADLGAILELTCRRVQEVFGAASCEFVLRDSKADLPSIATGDDDGRASPDGARTFPLRAGDEDLGRMAVGPRPDGRGYSEKEQQLLTAIANHAALAVERTSLTHEVSAAHLVRESDALKSALLSSISHDLRTPIAAIKAFATGLLEAGSGWDARIVQESLTGIDEEADRLNRLVGNLLDLSRLQSGALRINRDWCPISELVDESLHRLAGVLARHPIVRDVPTDLPPVSLDHALIQQVLINLLDNVAKHTPPGTPVRVSARRVGAEIRISVADEGPGIVPSQREAVFEKFYRLEESEGKRSGTGLGLAICRGFIEAHGGTIWVEDAAPGTTVTFSLPLETPEEHGHDEVDPDRG